MWLKIMGAISVLLFSTLMIAPSHPEPGAKTAGDRLFPHLGNGGYDVQHYTLDLTWQDNNHLSGAATLETIATQDLSAFTLDLYGLSVSAVTVEGQAADFVHDGQKLTITPVRPLAEGHGFHTEIVYEGVPRPDMNSGAGTPRGWNRTPHGIYVVSEPSGGATWFPSNNHPTDKATYTLHITVPEGYIVAASGIQQEVINNGDTTTFVWEVHDLTATYLLTLNIGNYIVVESQTASGLPLRSFFPNNATGLRLSQQDYQLEQIIEVFSSIFGEYPFEAYGVLFEPSFASANEMQTLPVFNPRYNSEQVVVHETAHQWFGNHVTLADWSDIWLNEGFATYAEFLYEEQVYGVEESDLFSRSGYNYVRTLPPPQPTPVNLFPISAYLRGGWTLHALRLKVGDAVFFDILQTYFAQFSGSHASTEDFIAIAEELSGHDLAVFFQGWLYDQNPPSVPELP